MINGWTGIWESVWGTVPVRRIYRFCSRHSVTLLSWYKLTCTLISKSEQLVTYGIIGQLFFCLLSKSKNKIGHNNSEICFRNVLYFSWKNEMLFSTWLKAKLFSIIAWQLIGKRNSWVNNPSKNINVLTC